MRDEASPVFRNQIDPHLACFGRGGGFSFHGTAHRRLRVITAHHCRAAMQEADRASSTRLHWSGVDDAFVAARWGQRAPPLVLFLSG